MTTTRKKTTAITVAIIMVFALSTIAATIPNVQAKITFTLDTGFYPVIGVNSPTQISWIPTPTASSPLATPGTPYYGQTSVWPNANVTFIRPDGSVDVVNGPFKMRPSTVQGRADRIDVVLVYTPNMQGTWNVTFMWPGDANYNSVRQSDTFVVGPHFEKRDTWAYFSMRPYPVVGLGQDVLINAWVTPPPVNQRDYYEGYMFYFTSPTGNSFTVGPMSSELPGTVWFNLPLTELGNWTIKFEFPGDHESLPASITRTITVQNDWIQQGYPDTPLPTQEWTFPIHTQNREWRTIAGPWYMANYNASVGAWNPYTEGVKTPHVLWKISSVDVGGQLGGYMGSPHSIETGGGSAQYDPGDAGLFSTTTPTIRTVMGGRGYFTASGNIYCVDMRTGETLWTTPGTFNVGSRRGRTDALYSFGSRFIAYDAITGAVILNVTGFSGMTFYDDPYVYVGQLTAAISPAWPDNYRLIKWDTSGSSDNFASRIVWNITDPAGPGGAPSAGGLGRYSFSAIQSGVWCSLNTAGPNTDAEDQANNDKIVLQNQDLTMIGVNVTTGEILYNKTLSNPADSDTWIYRQGPMGGSGYGLWYTATIPHENAGRGWLAVNAVTGNIAWVSEQTDMPWGNFWSYMPEASAYGMIIATGYSGVYGFNATNGKIVWHFIDQDVYNEEPYESNVVGSNAYPNNLNLSVGDTYASYSFGSTGPVVGGGIIYAPNTEHSPTFIYRGQGLCAIDALTGEGLWKIKGAWTPSAIAYGVLLASDSYNGFCYAFGKGSTQTTVSTQNDVYQEGNTVLLKGTVLDMSSAQKGTAAVSDASQTGWMEYLHMQQPFPLDATGVAVSIDALDPNNNFIHLGDATSDTTGQYSFLWETPKVPGKYTIVASFMGSDSYYSSEAEISIGLTAAPATSGQQPEQTQGQAPDYTWVLIGLGIAIVLAIAIATLLLLQKRA